MVVLKIAHGDLVVGDVPPVEACVCADTLYVILDVEPLYAIDISMYYYTNRQELCQSRSRSRSIGVSSQLHGRMCVSLEHLHPTTTTS